MCSKWIRNNSVNHFDRLFPFLSGALFLIMISHPSVILGASNAKADPKAVVEVGSARFTVLASNLIRMEWDSTRQFTDKASLFIVNRNLPVPVFKKKETAKQLVISTDLLVLKYTKGSDCFSDKNLEITFKDSKKNMKWHPGMKNVGNLKGTYRTLDNCKGQLYDEKTPINLEDGLLSTEGWTMIDDSKNFLFDGSDWNWVEPRSNKNGQDLYFICYGKDYKKALCEFTQVAGKVPIPPKFAFGYWWSRYWNYSDDELRTLVNNFHENKIPLDVLVVDMDWHKTKGLNTWDKFGQLAGWTGYTWEKSLFPEPDRFLKWVKDQNLKVTLNLHPASGIPVDEYPYSAFAKAMNFDTTGHAPIPFEAADKKYMTNLFDIVLHPMQKAGVSFWWLDWQQWPFSKKIDGLSNTWWLNYCFFTDMERQGTQRPMLYHRWGGLGNHRYQIGFSGDVIIDWSSLEFQPYFTSTASNVLYGYWSHDLGGHFFKNPDPNLRIDPELYVRWMQYGALSPIFRTHSTRDIRIKKDFWLFPYNYRKALLDAVNLRYSLVPYIYTMAKEDYDTGVSLCRPMYYDYPNADEAYSFKSEYMFGDNLLIAPITSPSKNEFSTVKVWLPAGNDWYEWKTGTMLKGGQTVDRRFLLDEYPIYVKAGSIIPMYDKVDNLEHPVNDLVVSVFPGNDSSEAKLYEDAGNDQGYQKGEFGMTVMKKEILPDGKVKITILPRNGAYPGMATKRNLEIRFHGASMPENVTVNGQYVAYSDSNKVNTWSYTGRDLTAHVTIPQVACDQLFECIVSFPANAVNVNGVIGKMNRLKLATDYLKNNWNRGDALPEIISLTNQTDIEILYYPKAFSKLIQTFNYNYSLLPEAIRNIPNVPVSKEAIEKSLDYIVEK